MNGCYRLYSDTVPTPSRKADMAAIAAELGVARSTVSNAYNRPDQLSAALRERILATAARLGYPGPDPVARSLRTRRAHAVGLVFAERLSFAFRDPASIGFLAGLSDACEAGGRSLLLIPLADGGSPEPVLRAAVDGFVIYSLSADDGNLAAIASRGLPLVVVDSPDGLGGADFVGVDDRQGVRAIGQHLQDLGHRDIGVVTVNAAARRTRSQGGIDEYRDVANSVMRERLAGLEQGMGRDSGSAGQPTMLVVERPRNVESEGAAAADLLLDSRPEITAIACLTDVLALGVLQTLARRGVRVPQDVSVTGFDDILEARSQGLTTVRQPLVDKGRVAGEMLLARSDAESATPFQRQVLPTRLIERTTTGQNAQTV
jgi:DNA-binding LacI/PurR family transcriptional regulator